MRYLPSFLILFALLLCSCKSHYSGPRNKYLEAKTRPSQVIAGEYKKSQKKSTKSWKRLLKYNKRGLN